MTNNWVKEPLLENLFFPNEIQKRHQLFIALSGGSDSLALLFLIKAYLEKHNLSNKLYALTVDHQLRAESTKEALWVQNLCAQYNIPHKILTWEGIKPLTNLAKKARENRYRLLIDEIKNYNSPILFTGHTQNDQAETYYMRLARNSELGLSAMARISYLVDGKKRMLLIRPLLKLSRSSLQNYLQKNGQSWINDPSNEDLRYERIRYRKKLTKAQILTAEKQVHLVAQKRKNIICATTQLLHNIKPEFSYNCFAFSYIKENENLLDNEYLPFLLAIISAILGNKNYFPGKKEIEFLKDKFCQAKEERITLTLQGTVLQKNKGKCLLWRENRHILPKMLLPFSKLIWDNRFLIENNSQNAFYIRQPTEEEIKDLLPKEDNKQKLYHRPALKTVFAIESLKKQTVEIPLLSLKKPFKNEKIKINHSLQPFLWLISSYDWPLYKKLSTIFKINLKNI